MSYSLLPALNSYHRLTVSERLPSVGYRFFLSPNGSYGHHMLIHKEGRFLSAIRQNGANNLESALAYHGGYSAFDVVSSASDVTNGAARAFHKALQDPSVQFLVQAVVIDIATAAKEHDQDVLKYVVKFINQASLPVVCKESSTGLDLIMGHSKVLSITAPKSSELIALLGPGSPAVADKSKKQIE